jgi:hypothetical protein
MVAGIAVTAGSLILYLSTIAPTLTWGWDGKAVDGGELVAAAHILGIPHPPGYPTYTLLLKGFITVVPVGDVAFRGNLFSALLAATTIFLVYWTIFRLCLTVKPTASNGLAIVGAVLGSAVFAASPLFWSQSVVTEVYTLNTAFAIGLTLVALRLALHVTPDPKRAPSTWDLLLFGLLFGVGLGNHLTLLAVGVPLLVWIAIARGWRQVVSPWLIGSLVIGLSVYLYLPIRAAQHPGINWGGANTFDGILWMVTGQAYQQYVFGVSASSLLDRAITWLELVFSQFNPLGLFFGIIAVRPLFTKATGLLVASAVSIAALTIYSISYNTVDFEVLMIPAFLLFSVWIGFGLFWILAEWLSVDSTSVAGSQEIRLPVPLSYQTLALSVIALVLVPGMLIVFNYGDQNLSGDRSALEHGRNLFSSVPDGTVLMSASEQDVFSLWYLHYVLRPERNIAVIATPLLQFDWYRDGIRRQFPDRVPDLTGLGEKAAANEIVSHNQGSSRVFFTYRDSSVARPYFLDQIGPVYEAKTKE